ncbi:MAG TPA: ribbon-helix-helix protein, CopG family [Candidatus Eisenbacteria bacterium]
MNDETRRATIYLDAELHRALKHKAAETDRSLSELVNDAVRRSIAEDAEDLAALRERAKEPTLKFEDFVRDLKRRGKL